MLETPFTVTCLIPKFILVWMSFMTVRIAAIFFVIMPMLWVYIWTKFTSWFLMKPQFQVCWDCLWRWCQSWIWGRRNGGGFYVSFMFIFSLLIYTESLTKMPHSASFWPCAGEICNSPLPKVLLQWSPLYFFRFYGRLVLLCPLHVFHIMKPSAMSPWHAHKFKSKSSLGQRLMKL